MRTYLAAFLLLALPASTWAGSVEIDCVGLGGGDFHLDPNDPGQSLSGWVHVVITIEETRSPEFTQIGISAQLADYPIGRLSVAGDGRFSIEPGILMIFVDNNAGGRAGNGSATFYSALIQPGDGFPDLRGASGEFGLGNDLSSMGGTLSVIPEPSSVILLPLGMIGAWLGRRWRAA